MTIILDPGHGMGNISPGLYDPGAVANGFQEATIAMTWVNTLRDVLLKQGHTVIRTRVDMNDPAHVTFRSKVARLYKGDIMLSFHCNSYNGTANGTETFYRGAVHKEFATRLNTAVVSGLGTKDRGVKLEKDSQHKSLAVMSFQPCYLIELGFIDNKGDLAKMTDPRLVLHTCELIGKLFV